MAASAYGSLYGFSNFYIINPKAQKSRRVASNVFVVLLGFTLSQNLCRLCEPLLTEGCLLWLALPHRLSMFFVANNGGTWFVERKPSSAQMNQILRIGPRVLPEAGLISRGSGGRVIE